jgi:hypothetical protein
MKMCRQEQYWGQVESAVGGGVGETAQTYLSASCRSSSWQPAQPQKLCSRSSLGGMLTEHDRAHRCSYITMPTI